MKTHPSENPRKTRVPSRSDFSRFIPREPSAAEEHGWLARKARLEAAERRALRQQRLERADELELTDAIREALLLEVALEPTPSLADAQRWVSGHPKPWLVLSGSTGCGKSVAAAWILSQHGGLWVSAERAVRVFSASFGEQYEEQEELRRCRLLFVDDVGTERDDQRMLGLLVELLEARKSSRRRTVMTTNMALGAFSRRYEHARLSSRMQQSVHWCNSKHRDLRRTQGDTTCI